MTNLNTTHKRKSWSRLYHIVENDFSKTVTTKWKLVLMSALSVLYINFQDRRMSSTDVVNLIRQKEGLLRKLADFEVTNKALRKLLKEQSRYEVGTLHPACMRLAWVLEKSLV